MKCKCGGNLRRIAIDCYECENCRLKQKVAFAKLPTEIKSSKTITIGIVGNGGSPVMDILKEIGKKMCEVKHGR